MNIVFVKIRVRSMDTTVMSNVTKLTSLIVWIKTNLRPLVKLHLFSSSLHDIIQLALTCEWIVWKASHLWPLSKNISCLLLFLLPRSSEECFCASNIQNLNSSVNRAVFPLWFGSSCSLLRWFIVFHIEMLSQVSLFVFLCYSTWILLPNQVVFHFGNKHKVYVLKHKEQNLWWSEITESFCI